MAKSKIVLGRGLDALINPNSYENDDKKIINEDSESNEKLAMIPVNNISPNPYQPRVEFEQKALEELKQSIIENGLIQPITVRKLKKNDYELISGERRLRACKEIGFQEIPAYIIKVENKETLLALALIENIQREELNAIEIAQAYEKLLNECNLTQEEIAKQVGKERSTITNSLRLLKLPLEIQKYLIDDVLSAGHCRALLTIENNQIQLEIAEKIIKENLSVRKTEELVKNFSKNSTKLNDDLTPEKSDIHLKDFEDRLQVILGTKVSCKQKKDGTGELTIKYFSKEELDRIFELFENISNQY